MIDLHLHTTASDGRSTPDTLVQEVRAAGIHTFAVTDHDTVAAVPAVRKAALLAGLTFVPGIEVTAVHGGRDVHVLGYFVDENDGEFGEFLLEQRADRGRRAREMTALLARLGAPIDDADLLAGAAAGRAIGRPHLAAALVTAGHARDIADAFDRYIGEGKPGYVARRGASPAEVIRRIRLAGGMASVAHPVKLTDDSILPALVESGLSAIEVFHPDHDTAAVERYQGIASRLGLVVTGGSDYHGPGTSRAGMLGRVGLSGDQYEQFAGRASGRHR